MSRLKQAWLHIDIQEIKHEHQRYVTVGDYFQKKAKWCFRISHMSDWRYVILVAVHELVEWSLCIHRKISMKSIDDFDKKFEAERAIGLHTEDEEPGDCPCAPYQREHAFATAIERLLAGELGVDWNSYDKEVMSL